MYYAELFYKTGLVFLTITKTFSRGLQIVSYKADLFLADLPCHIPIWLRASQYTDCKGTYPQIEI